MRKYLLILVLLLCIGAVVFSAGCVQYIEYARTHRDDGNSHTKTVPDSDADASDRWFGKYGDLADLA